MPPISVEEQARRTRMMDSVRGTNAMEGLFPDGETLVIMRRYETGEYTMEQFSSAMDSHAHELVAQSRALAGAA